MLSKSRFLTGEKAALYQPSTKTWNWTFLQAERTAAQQQCRLHIQRAACGALLNQMHRMGWSLF